MNKEKLYKESETFPIYRNYGVLGAEDSPRTTASSCTRRFPEAQLQSPLGAGIMILTMSWKGTRDLVSMLLTRTEKDTGSIWMYCKTNLRDPLRRAAEMV